MSCKRAVMGLLLGVLLWGCPTGVAAQNKELQVSDIYGPTATNFGGVVPRVEWLADGKHYLEWNFNPALGDVGVFKVEAHSGKREAFMDLERMQTALRALAGFSAENARRIATFGLYKLNSTKDGALINFNNDLYYYDIGSGKARALTSSPQVAETDESFSPDNKRIGFVRDNNLYVMDLVEAKEQPLTTDGNKDIFNGRLDWVYEEEIYGRGVTQSYWWNPQGTEIAFLRLDDSKVAEFTVTDDIPLYQRQEHTKYPKSGTPNPTVKLGVVTVGSATTTQWVELATYEPQEFLITRVGWTPDGRQVIFQVQNREQNWLDLNVATSATGKVQRLLREESKAWVEVVELPEWLPDNTFIWQSDRSGWRHLYHYNREGKLLAALTQGEWEIKEFYGTSDGWVYFSGSKDSPINNDLYRLRLDNRELVRLSTTAANHSASFNPQHTAYLENRSAYMMPIQTRLYQANGQMIRAINENKVAALSEYKLGSVEFFRIPTRDGFKMNALMIRPPNFDPNKKYPVMCYTYSGPGAPSVRNAWLGAMSMWHQMLASKGYVVWICDNRSATQQGVQSAQPIYRNLGELELADLEDGIAWLKQRHNFVDGSRIGLWGWSYGGYMTAYALTHSKTFKMGIAGAPVTDWRNYDSIYTERYMGLPKNNPEGYRRSSVIEAAAQLHGKLLLIHGTIDDNVHLQNSIQFIDALQKAGKQFSFMVYPQSRHGVVQPLRVRHLREMMTQFILENL
jgi:dipeptidyl-peptidase 4